MDVSIIFVNYKTKDLTINAINSVIEKTEDLEYEVFVVDNNSQDGSIEAIGQEFPNINIIKNHINAGFGTANNLAIKQARGKYILCLNTDTLLINNAIKIMFDFMEKEENQQVGVCGGYLVDGDNKPTTMGGHLPTIQELLLKFDFCNSLKPISEKYAVNINSEEALKCKTINSITGANIFFRSSVLEKVGLFDEQIFMYYEDADLCKRIMDKGYQIKYVPEAKIIHLDGKSSTVNIQKRKIAKKGQLIYFKKHHPQQVWLVKAIYIFFYLIDWLIVGNKYSKELMKIIIKG